MRHLFGPLRHLNFWEMAAFESNGGETGNNDDSPSPAPPPTVYENDYSDPNSPKLDTDPNTPGTQVSTVGGHSTDNDDNNTTTTTTTDIPEFDTYYDAIDAGYGGQEVSIGGQNVLAETADGYTGSGYTANDSYVDDTFGTGNIYTESTPGASTVNYGNTVDYSDNDNDYSYVDTSNIQGISDASGVDYTPIFVTEGTNLGSTYDEVPTNTELNAVEKNLVSLHGWTDNGDGTVTNKNGGIYDGESGGYLEGYSFEGPDTPDVYTPLDFDDEDYTPTSDELNAAIDAAGGINLTDSDYAADVDYTTTGSGSDYTSTATADDDDLYVAPIPDLDPPAPPSVYYDALGNPYGSQAEAAAADAAAEQAAAQAAANMAAAFDEPTAAEIAAANAAAQREAYDEDEYTVMSQPVSSAVPDPTGSEISYADILSSAGVSDEEIDSMRENILTGDTDYDLEPLDFSFLDETNELLGELGVAPIDVDALTKVGDTGINLEGANKTPSAITDMALGGDDAPITYDGDQALGASGGLDTGRYDYVDDLPDDALDFVNTGVGATDDDLATDFSAIPTGVGATDDDLSTDFSTVSTDGNVELEALINERDALEESLVPNETLAEAGKDLAFQNYLDSLVDTDFTDPSLTGLEAFEQDLYNDEQSDVVPDFLVDKTTSDIEAIEDAADIFQNEGAEALRDYRMDLGMSPVETSVSSDEALARAEADMSGLDILSDQNNQEDTGAATTTDIPTEQEINQAASTETGQSGTDLYLSAMAKVSDPNYDPNDPNSTVRLSDEEQRALYGARGQTPNAAETAYLNDLLSNARHAKDSEIIGADGEPIYKAGDYVTAQSFGDKLGDFAASAFDLFINPLSVFGEDFTIVGQNKKYVQEQLDAYKNGGTFVYDDDGKTVVGIAEANYDADNDGQNDTVVLYDEDGKIQVTGDAIGVDDVKTSNANADGEEFDIDIVDSDRGYTNTEDGVVTTTSTVGVDNDNDDNIPICEEGFEFDPVEGICMPIDEIGDGTGKVKLKPRIPLPVIDDPAPPETSLPKVGGLTIRRPSFNKGGVVTRNIDKFANGGVVTPNIDNFMSGMR